MGKYSLNDSNIETKSKTIKEPSRSLLQRLFYPLLRMVPTDWLVQILMSRYDVYLIVLTNLTKENKIKGGKRDGSVEFTQKGRLHWKGTKIQMLGMLMQTAEEITPHFPDSEVPDNLDFGGLMSKENGGNDHE